MVSSSPPPNSNSGWITVDPVKSETVYFIELTDFRPTALVLLGMIEVEESVFQSSSI